MGNPTTLLRPNVPTFQQRTNKNNQITNNHSFTCMFFLLERWKMVGTRWNSLRVNCNSCWNTFFAPRAVGTLARIRILLIIKGLMLINLYLLERWSVGREKSTPGNKKKLWQQKY